MILATEDELGEAMGERLIAHTFGHNTQIQCLGRKGNGYLRSKLTNFVNMARRDPVIIFTDLDALPCAGELVSEWSSGLELPENLLLRVAVREAESWLLADRENFANFLGVKLKKIPHNPEALADPKQHLLVIAGGARRNIRSELVVPRGVNASRGMGYNRLLSGYVKGDWDFENAAGHSQSLRRTIARLSELADRIRH